MRAVEAMGQVGGCGGVEKLGVRGECWGGWRCYRGTSLIRNSAPLGPYRRTMPRALW